MVYGSAHNAFNFPSKYGLSDVEFVGIQGGDKKLILCDGIY